MTNRLYYGDNLSVLRDIPYVDPTAGMKGAGGEDTGKQGALV